MKVSRAQAEENRQKVIEASSRLFRQNGFDGVGVNTLMKAAGLTHGGFYKQFKSKDDLIAQATGVALAGTRARLRELADNDEAPSFKTVVRHYLSEPHRDGLADGCALAALGMDAARQGPEVRQIVESGLIEYLDLLEAIAAPSPGQSTRDKAMATLSTMVGALVLSRAVEDRDLSAQILTAATKEILGRPAVSSDREVLT